MKKVIFKILDLIIANNGAVFGGFVRDMLANKKFKDIDVWFKYEADRLGFQTRLSDQYDCCITDVKTSNEMYFMPIGHSNITVTEDDEEIKLDVLSLSEYDFFNSHRKDINVNRLYLSKNGIQSYCTEDSTFNIIKSIKNNYIKPERNLDDIGYASSIKIRLEQLINNGWELDPEVLIEYIIK